MKPTVYVETSVVSYYTARPSRDIWLLERQEITRRWWASAPDRFRLVASEMVVLEIGLGDSSAARKRLDAIRELPVLAQTERCDEVGKWYLKELPLPDDAARDAIHLAIASVYGVDYLLTWNCAHLANASLRRKLAEVNERLVLPTPIILTPKELMEK